MADVAVVGTLGGYRLFIHPPPCEAKGARAISDPQPSSNVVVPVDIDQSLLEQLAHEMDLLSSRAESVNASLTALRESQRQQGMALRGNVASWQQRMQKYLTQVQAALSNHDALDARKYLGLAETEVVNLERY